MKNRHIYAIGLVLSVVAFFGSVFIPESMADLRIFMVLLCMACFIVFFIALIVSGIRGRIAAKQAPVQTAAASIQPTPEPVKPKAETIMERVHVRGVDNYAANIEEIATENPDYGLTKRELQEDFLDERVWQYIFPVKAALVPEPDNEYDPNAIMVQADGLCIGYVPRGSTSHIRKLMESGRIDHMKLKIGGGKYKEVTEVDEDEYELDRDENPYSAILEIYLTGESDELS